MAINLVGLTSGAGIDCGNVQSASKAASDSFSVAAWVYPVNWSATTISTGTGGFPNAWMIFTAGGPETETIGLNAPWMLLVHSASKTIGFDWEDRVNGQNRPMTGSTALTLNTWQHIAVTYTNATASFYLNGNLDVTRLSTATGSGRFPDTSSNQRLGIGCTITSAGVKTGIFGGKISDCAFWKTVLAPNEVQQLAQSRQKYMPFQIQPSFLHLYYPLDEVAHGSIAPTTAQLVKNRASGSFGNGTIAGNVVGAAEDYLSYL